MVCPWVISKNQFSVVRQLYCALKPAETGKTELLVTARVTVWSQYFVLRCAGPKAEETGT